MKQKCFSTAYTNKLLHTAAACCCCMQKFVCCCGCYSLEVYCSECKHARESVSMHLPVTRQMINTNSCHSCNYFGLKKSTGNSTLPLLIARLVHFVQLELAQPPSMMVEEPQPSKTKAKKKKNAEGPTETPKTSPAQNIEGKVISGLIAGIGSTWSWRREYWRKCVVLGKRQLAAMTIMIHHDRWWLSNLIVFSFPPMAAHCRYATRNQCNICLLKMCNSMRIFLTHVCVI